MFDRVFDLPAHPLFIHAAVVLVPLLAVAGLLYAVLPVTRRHVRWVLAAFAVAAPGAVYFARASGQSFRKDDRFQSPQMQQTIANHSNFGDMLFTVILGLGVVALLLAYFVKPVPASTGVPPLAVYWALVVLTVALSVASLYYVFKAGDSGARMVWG